MLTNKYYHEGYYNYNSDRSIKMLKKIYVLLIISAIIILPSCSKEKNEEPKITKEDVISEILTYDLQSSYIDEDFLNWINDNYQLESLITIKDKLNDSSYQFQSWHDVTGKSLQVLYDSYQNNYENKDNVKVITDNKEVSTINFVGDISLADNFDIMPYYDSRQEGVYGILSEDVVDIMQKADLMVANNEFSFSDRGVPLPNKYYTFRGSPSRVSIYHEMGVDLVSLANNHVYDYGEDAFLDTITTLDNADIAHVGAGKNKEEAQEPYYYIIGGYKVAFISATRAEKFILTPEATETQSGVFRCYDPEELLSLIKTTKQESDYVIVLLHWGKEDSHDLEQVQIDTGKQYIDAGADLIVGSHAHVLQGMEYYNDKLIAYNLGDFIFNREDKDTGILSMNIHNDGTLSYQFIPCHQKDYKTTLLANDAYSNAIANMNSWSINATLDEEGNILKTN